ncbi:MAG: GspJ family type II secretion system protein [Candidatus Omnitrophica bacterium]|nr:GspJ family type II secretion system protein [Candidatus Omnitrophota bacterium]
MLCIKNKKNFTLIELIIVIGIATAISFGIYKMFSSGAKIWQKIKSITLEEDINIFFQKFSLELNNTFKFSLIDFSGEIDRIMFPAIINSFSLKQKSPGEIKYYFDSNKGALIKEERDFSQIYNDSEGITKILLDNVASCKFRYYTYDEEKQEYVWQDNWKNNKLPLAVEVNLVFYDNGKIKNFIKTVDIPTAN